MGLTGNPQAPSDTAPPKPRYSRTSPRATEYAHSCPGFRRPVDWVP